MSRELPRQIAVILVIVICLIGSWASYQYWSIMDRLEGEPIPRKISVSEADSMAINDSVLIDSMVRDTTGLDSSLIDSVPPTAPYIPIEWFTESFDPGAFADPGPQYRPWARWYWPGNAVDRLELIREIDQFSSMGLGGLEIHPTLAGLDPDAKVAEDMMNEAHSPLYWHNIKLAISELRKRGLETDLFISNGGRHISLDENLKSLAFSEMHVLGGKPIDIEIPDPQMSASYFLSAWAEDEYQEQLGEWLDFYPGEAQLVTLIAAKTLEENRTFIDLDLNDFIKLNFDSLYVIDEYVTEEGRLIWDAPKGFWKMIAIYQMPTGTKPVLLHSSQKGLTRNYLDSAVNRHHYAYTLEAIGQLDDFRGNGLRGIFDQRMDVMAENVVSREILDQFDEECGYDLSPYLPVLLSPGRHNPLMEALQIKRHPEYIITDADERIRHDYDAVMSRMLAERYFGFSKDYLAGKKLIQRAQPFGFDFDILKAAGNTQIPEVSQFYGGGSEMFLKLIVSGANLYHRNLISAQALSHPGQGAALAPWEVKLGLDKLFTAGINHLVLDGFSYQKVAGNYTELGWNPYLSPHFPFQFSTIFTEKSQFYDHLSPINAYISRCQYLLRQGKPEVEVLIYYPFMGFPSSFAIEKGHDEFYFNGESIYPDSLHFPTIYQSPAISLPTEKDPRVDWLRSVWPVIQAMEEKGLSWNWVNDESLQQARVEDGKISIRDNAFQAVLLPNVPAIELATARNLSLMHAAGGRVYIYGKAPTRQKSFYNYHQNDLLVNKYMLDITVPGFLNTPEDLMNLFRGEPFEQVIAYKSTYPFLRQIRRRLPGGAHIAFLRNNLDKDRFFEMSLAPEIKHCYWFNPTNGEIYQAQIDKRNRLRGFLFGYGSKILFCSSESPLPDSLLSPLPRIERGILPEKEVNNKTLNHWDFIVSGRDVISGEVLLQDTTLKDWRAVDGLKFCSSEGLYTTHFELADTLMGKRYILDLGSIYDVADVKINTELVKSLIFHPYRVDITDYLIPGPNTIEIWVTPSLRNRFIGYARKGNNLYQHFDEANDYLLPTGLLGPVRIWEVNE
jgi:hypothetical protein